MKAPTFGIILIALYLNVGLLILKKLPWIDITLKPISMYNFVNFGQEMSELHTPTFNIGVDGSRLYEIVPLS